MAARELRNLTTSYLSDGARGIERPSLHKVSANAITPRMKTLFLSGAAERDTAASQSGEAVVEPPGPGQPETLAQPQDGGPPTNAAGPAGGSEPISKQEAKLPELEPI